MEEPFLQTVFDHILSRDVVKKLMQVTQVNETMAASNGFLPGEYDEMKEKPMMLMKKGASDGHGITALISRQLQGKINMNRCFLHHVYCNRMLVDFYLY